MGIATESPRLTSEELRECRRIYQEDSAKRTPEERGYLISRMSKATAPEFSYIVWGPEVGAAGAINSSQSCRAGSVAETRRAGRDIRLGHRRRYW